MREGIALLGAAAIFGAALFFTKVTPFPGPGALLPCMGAVALIYTAGHTIIGRMLSLRALVFCGLVSYSLYLWHWPALVFARYYNVVPLSALETAFVVAATFIVAVLSWRFVEQPFRARDVLRPAHTLRLASVVTVAAVVFGAGLSLSKGWPERFTPETQQYLALMNSAESLRLYDHEGCFLNLQQRVPDYDVAKCLPISDRSRVPRIVIWGDSFAAHLYPGLKEHVERMGGSVFQYTMVACRPMDVGSEERCNPFFDALETALQDRAIDIIILAGRWGGTYGKITGGESAFRDKLNHSIARAKRLAAHVILVGQSPTYDYLPTRLAFMHPSIRDNVTTWLQAHDHRAVNNFLKDVAAESGIKFFDPFAKGCRQSTCLAFIDGRPLHWDVGHMTLEGSAFFTSSLARVALDAVKNHSSGQRVDRASSTEPTTVR